MENRRRLGLVALGSLSIAALYAEGVLKNGLIGAALLVPVLWLLVSTRWATFASHTVLALSSACLTVSAVDLALRPFMERRLHYAPTNIFARQFPRLPSVGRWDANVEFSGEAYGDLAALAQSASVRETRRIEFRTDPAGFRNDEITGPIDLLVVGDSFSAGVGTTQERIFSRLLTHRYGQRTYNLAFPGGPWDECINVLIETPRLTFAPGARLIWTLYTGNDLDDAYGDVWDPAALPWKSGFQAWRVAYRTYRNRSPLNQIMEGLRHRWRGPSRDLIKRTLPDGRSILFLGGHEDWGGRSRADVEQHPNFPRLEKTFSIMKDLAVERGLGLTVLVFPTKGEVYRWVLENRSPRTSDQEPSGFAAAVLAACERSYLKCIDAKPFLAAEARHVWESSRVLLWWRDDTHLGERGHEAVATLIADQILGLGAREGAEGGDRRL